MKILFTGGGTGGHIIPIIAIAREIIRHTLPKEAKFFYIGPEDDLTRVLLPHEGFTIKEILAGKIRRFISIKSILQNLYDILVKIPIGIAQSFFQLFFIFPDLIFSKGGFGSLPVVIAAQFFGIPVFLHESDVSPGLANRLLNKFASAVFVSFLNTEYFSTAKAIVVGNPLRKGILNGSKEEAKKIFKITGGKPVILILGGSQGAQRINDVVLMALPQLLRGFELIHQTGVKNFETVKTKAKILLSMPGGRTAESTSFQSTLAEKREAEEEKIWKEKEEKEENLEKYYHPVPFLKETDLREAYAVSDFVLSRAGSGTIFELAAVGKPAILIPLPEAAQNHQVKNGYRYAESGAAIVIEEDNLTPQFLVEKLRYLFVGHPEQLKKMAEEAKEFSRPRAAEVISGYIIDYLILAGR